MKLNKRAISLLIFSLDNSFLQVFYELGASLRILFSAKLSRSTQRHSHALPARTSRPSSSILYLGRAPATGSSYACRHLWCFEHSV